MNKLFSHIISAAIVCFGTVNVTSCVSILEKPSTSDVTLETIYSNRQYAESALYRVYHVLVPKGFPYTNGNYPENTSLQPQTQFSRSLLASITDECTNVRGATPGQYVNAAGFDALSASRNQEDSFAKRWPGIRAAWTFIAHINEVPDSEIPSGEKEQMKAEAKALIALAYMDMFPRYGALPIVDHVLGEGDATLLVPRGTFKETIDFIVQLCDEAAEELPDTYASDKIGRITKGVVLCIKARTLLYAASPLYNSVPGDLPIPGYDHPEYLCYCNYDKERWLEAAKASDQVLKWAKTAGVSLITSADIDGGETDGFHNAYGYATSVNDNREVILANKGYSASNNGFLDGIYFKDGNSRGLTLNFNILPVFRKADGSDQVWPDDLEVKHPFSEYTEKMNAMEPRFKQCAWPVDQNAPNHKYGSIYNKWPYSKVGNSWRTSAFYGVAGMVKFHYNYNGENMKNWIVFRLGEFYLDYAEAVNEYYGAASASVPGGLHTAQEAVNIIRNRGQLRSLIPAETASQEIFREQIVRERGVELFAEGHRWWDTRRWKIADNTLGATMYTFQFYRNNDVAAQATGYDYYAFMKSQVPHVWKKAMYFYPFPQDEVDKGYVPQNPGY